MFLIKEIHIFCWRYRLKNFIFVIIYSRFIHCFIGNVLICLKLNVIDVDGLI
jgi:hypothetical protein